MRKIFIAIPSWNRFQQTVDSFAQVMDDERISKIYITDDASTDGSLEKLQWHFKDSFKVFVYHNPNNLDCYKNKYVSMKNARGEWGILLDSDNTITPEYLDAIYSIPEWGRHTIYQPSFAKPHFDFRQWEGLTLTKENVASYADTHLTTAMNAMNFFIHREEYLKTWDGSVEPGSSDSLYFSKCWLENGNKILITPNLFYEHFIDPEGKGHYQNNSRYYVKFHEELMHKIKQLR